jgi:spore coat polysaccharide biosynthesis predicted glycosyltransferase SpsG
MPVLVYRVDGGAELGLGHLARAAALSDAFAGRTSWTVRWASTGGPAVEAAAAERGIELATTRAGEDEEAFVARAAAGAAALVLDRKLPYSAAFVAGLNRARPVVLMDVACEGMFAAAAAVFPGAHVDPALAADHRWRAGQPLHGAEWVLIHPSVRAARTARRPGAGPAQRVVVATGGSDPTNVAARALDWLNHLSGSIAVDLLVGAANPRGPDLVARAARAKHATTVWSQPEAFPQRMARADLAVATFGVTAYELAFLGVPAVLVSHNDENAVAAGRYAACGAGVDLGLIATVQDAHAAEQVEQLLTDGALRRRMSETGRRMVDGRGAERIADVIQRLVDE